MLARDWAIAQAENEVARRRWRFCFTDADLEQAVR
jgi:hypothetical protein